MNMKVLLFTLLAATAILSPVSAQTTERWFLGVPDPANSNLIQFLTPVPQDFVTKVMQQQRNKAPLGKSYKRSVGGTEYSILEQTIAWDTGFSLDQVTYVTPQAGGGSTVGADWVQLSGPEWEIFKQSLAAVSKQYGDGGTWREAQPMVMQIPGTSPPHVTINMITPFVAADAPSEQIGYAAMSPRIVAVPVGNAIVVGYQTEFNETKQAAEVVMYRPGSTAPAWKVTLPLQVFGGLTTDGQHIYALSGRNENLGKELSTVNFRNGILNMIKIDGNGRTIWEKDLNNSEVLGSSVNNGMEGHAIYSPFTGGTAQLAYGDGQVAVALACNTPPDLPISSRHQQAIFFTVNAKDGTGSASHEATSWRHSFDQRAIFDGRDFVFADIGDAGWYMPGAGIALRKGLPQDGKTSFAPADIKEGVYVFARSGDQTSHSNFSFTSLGDVVYDQKGYGVLFTSQKENYVPPKNGHETPVQAPRQLAFVHVVESFETVQDSMHNSLPRLGNVIMDAGFKPERINITGSVVDSNGTNAGPFGHPTRSNTLFNQHGVVWMTQLPNGVSAERPKMVRLSNGAFLALWEEWTYEGTGQNLTYKETKTLLLQDQGNGGFVADSPQVIDARLNPSGADRVFVRNDRVNWVTADSDGRLSLHQVGADLTLNSMALGESAIPDGSAPQIASRGRNTQQPPKDMATNELPADQKLTLPPGELTRGKRYLTADGSRFLMFADDGNVVVGGVADGSYFWGLNARPGVDWQTSASVHVTNEGRFEVRDAIGTVIWAIPDNPIPGSVLDLNQMGVPRMTKPGSQVESYSLPLSPGTTIQQVEKYSSMDGQHYLIYAGVDNNLMIVRTADDGYVWGLDQQTGVDYGQAALVRFNDAGFLEVLDGSGKVIYQMKVGNPGARLGLDATGKFTAQ